MPPFRRFWLVYLVFALIFAGLALAALYLSENGNSEVTPWVLFSGVAVAAVGIAANSFTQWRTACVAHAVDGLQTLRTDREYLINAYVVRRTVGTFGKPLSAEARAKFFDIRAHSTVDKPSFRDASLFLLNQYEFLAAGVRDGVLDYNLMRTTMRGPIVSVVITFAGPIMETRTRQPAAFNNLLWLYRRFRGAPPFDRGPIP